MYRPNPSCDRVRMPVKAPNLAMNIGAQNLSVQLRQQVNIAKPVNLPTTAGILADQRGFSKFSAIALVSGVGLGVLANILLFEKYVITPEVLSNLQGTDELIYRRGIPIGEGVAEGLLVGGLLIAAASIVSRIKGGSPQAAQITDSSLSGKTRESKYTEVKSVEIVSSRPDPVEELSSKEVQEVLLENIGEDGTLFGTYRIIGKLGEGGFGAVVKAEWIKLKETVAIKLVKQDNLENLERFRAEAKVMLKLHHPNIVRFYSYEEREGYYCIIMEYVEGKNLFEVIKESRKPMEEKEALKIIRLAAKGLAEAYELGLLHRDIKPGNIMKLDKKPYVKVCDFGLAKGAGTGDHTKTGVLAGSPSYIAPERIKKMLGADETIDHRSDIYSLVCVLYFLLTGKPPYNNDQAEEVLRGHLRGEIPDPRKLNPRVSPEGAALIIRGLQKDPNDRFATYEEFDQALAQLGG